MMGTLTPLSLLLIMKHLGTLTLVKHRTTSNVSTDTIRLSPTTKLGTRVGQTSERTGQCRFTCSLVSKWMGIKRFDQVSYSPWECEHNLLLIAPSRFIVVRDRV